MIDNSQARLHAHEQFALTQARPHLTRCVSGNSLYILTHPELQDNSGDLASMNEIEFEPTDTIHPYITLQNVEETGVQDSFSTENSLQSPDGLHDNINPNVYASEQFPDACEGLEYLDFNYSTEFAPPCVRELSSADIPAETVKDGSSYNANDVADTDVANNTIGHSNNFNPTSNNNHNNKVWTQEFNVDELNETEFNELTGDLVDMFSDDGLISSPPELTVNGASYGSSSAQAPNHEYKEISYQMDIQNNKVSQALLRPHANVSYGHRPSASGMRARIPNATRPPHHEYAHHSIPKPDRAIRHPRPDDGEMDFGGLGIFLSPNTSPDDDSAIQVRKNEALLPANHPLHLRLNYPRHFLTGDNINESADTHLSQGVHGMLRNPRDMLRSDHSQKSQSISKMPLAHMYAMMGLSNDHVKAKWREERIIDIVRAEGFKVGSQTWIRDTEESERFRIINSILFQCGREFGYDKTLIEIIVRRGTYARMQSKLRQERRIKRRVMASQKPIYRPPMHFHQSEL